MTCGGGVIIMVIIWPLAILASFFIAAGLLLMGWLALDGNIYFAIHFGG